MGEDIDLSDSTVNFYEFYNRTDAQANFEKRFFEKTSNKWVDHDYFKEKPGKFVLLNKDKKVKQLKEAQDLEQELLEVISESEQKFACRLD